MRTFILIAALALVSASAQAQAGDSRSLSTGLTTTMPNDKPTTPREPRADESLRAYNDTPSTNTPRQLTETPRNETPRAETDTPRYNVRPPAVDTPPATTTPATTTTPTAHDPQPSSDTPSHQRRRHAYADRDDQEPRHRMSHGYRGTRWTTGRIIAELHRYGIYW
jgi:hypothetical protein